MVSGSVLWDFHGIAWTLELSLLASILPKRIKIRRIFSHLKKTIKTIVPNAKTVLKPLHDKWAMSNEHASFAFIWIEYESKTCLNRVNAPDDLIFFLSMKLIILSQWPFAFVPERQAVALACIFIHFKIPSQWNYVCLALKSEFIQSIGHTMATWPAALLSQSFPTEFAK